MGLKELVILALVVSILCTVFGFGLRAHLADLLYVVRRPGLLARSLLSVFVLMPAVAVLLVRLFDFRHEVEVALIALAISPMPPLLPNRLTKAGADTSYAVGLLATLGLTSIVAAPLLLSVISRLAERPFDMSVAALAGTVLKMIVAPLVAGLIVRAASPSVASSLLKVVTMVANVLLPLGVLLLLPAVAPAMWAIIGEGTLIAMVLFVAAGLAIGHFLGGPDPDKSAVLAIASACRHPAIALSIASANFPEQHFGATILLFVIVSAIAVTPYIVWHKGRSAVAIRPA